MKLFTCNQGKAMPAVHFCGKAAKALDDAGYDYELEKVKGYRLMPWTRSGDARDEVERLSGQKNVPILVLDSGEVISGSGTIAEWAKANPKA